MSRNFTDYLAALLVSLGLVVGTPYLAYQLGMQQLSSTLQLLSFPGMFFAGIFFGGIHSVDPANAELYVDLWISSAVLLWVLPLAQIFGIVRTLRSRRNIGSQT